MRKFIMLAVVALFATGCGLSSSEVNETCLVYSGGVVEDKEFQFVMEPGSTSKSVGVGSEVYCYPNDQRSWVSGQDAPEVTVVSADEVNLTVPYQLYFKLNTDDGTLVKFHENIGVKVDAWTDAGWLEMLNTYFAPQVDRAMDEAALAFDWRELRSSSEVREQFQRDVVTSLKRKVTEVVGGDYFCGPNYTGGDAPCGDFTFTVGKPEPTNGSLVASIEQEQINQTKVAAQEAENLRIRAELEARREEVQLYGPEVYACLKQIEAAQAVRVAPPICLFSGAGNDVVITTNSSGAAATTDDE